MNKSLALLAALAIVIFVIAAFTFQNQPNEKSALKVTVFKAPTCGCCVQYIAELQRQGFSVEIVTTQNMAEVKQRHGIPNNMESCHTSVIGNYFVEGHVPIETVKQLLEEQPNIDGIALPRMPSGSPGMPGAKLEPFRIYSLVNGNAREYKVV